MANNSLKYYFTIEYLKEKLKKGIKDYEEEIKAWDLVTRKYKKDGTDFANLEKNFENLKIRNEYGNMKATTYYYDKQQYYHASYDLWGIGIKSENLTEEEKAKRKCIHYDFYGNPTEYEPTANEVMQQITDRIKIISKEIEIKKALMEQLENHKIIKLMLELQKEYNKIDYLNPKNEQEEIDRELFYLVYDFIG